MRFETWEIKIHDSKTAQEETNTYIYIFKRRNKWKLEKFKIH